MTSATCPEPVLVEVPESDDIPLFALRQKAERLLAEMNAVLDQAIARSSVVSGHRLWLKDAREDIDLDPRWQRMSWEAEYLKREAQASHLCSNEEADCLACAAAMRAAADALRDLTKAEWRRLQTLALEVVR